MPNTPAAYSPKSVFHKTASDHWIEKLIDGTPVLIRPLRAADRERERDFIKRLSPEARRSRFFDTMSEPSPALLDQLMNVDYRDSLAFVALAHEDGVLREVGVSRYAATDNTKHCECAITVAEGWRHRGLAVTLMRYLIDAARHNGFTQIFSIESVNNGSMNELAHYLGFYRFPDPNDATQVVHKLDL